MYTIYSLYIHYICIHTHTHTHFRLNDYFSTKGGVNFNSELRFSHFYHVRNGKDLIEAEDINKRWQEYTEELS